MTDKELNEQILKIIKEHFEDIDKLCNLLEDLVNKMSEMEMRIQFLETKLPNTPEDIHNDLILS